MVSHMKLDPHQKLTLSHVEKLVTSAAQRMEKVEAVAKRLWTHMRNTLPMDPTSRRACSCSCTALVCPGVGMCAGITHHRRSLLRVPAGPNLLMGFQQCGGKDGVINTREIKDITFRYLNNPDLNPTEELLLLEHIAPGGHVVRPVVLCWCT